MVRWDYTTDPGSEAERDEAVARRLQSGAPWEELVGAMFTTPKELRHLAEQHFGQLFVPTRVLVETPLATVVALRVSDLGEFMVHAERTGQRYPFRVVRVEWSGSGRASA